MKRELRKTPGSGKEKKEHLEKLIEYRAKQAKLAIYRDNSLCVSCYWINHKITPYAHVHHTEGRGTFEKEKYTKLICLCDSCHQIFSAMRVPRKEIHQLQQQLVKLANDNPINKEFKHNFDEQN